MNFSNPEVIALAVLRYIVFLLSTTCHEAAHALAAKLGGDQTASHAGQVTLNPVPHIVREPFGMVVVPLLSLATGGGLFGWASAPYDPLWQQRYPRRAAWMSLAGPAANFSLVLIAALLIHVGLITGSFRAPDSLNNIHLVEATTPGVMEGVAKFLSVLFSLNLLLGTFNLIPFPPLDGFGAAGLLMPRGAGARWAQMGLSMRSYSFIGLLVAWQLFDKVYGSIFITGIRLLYPSAGYQ
jgi:Zn-dependent protease